MMPPAATPPLHRSVSGRELSVIKGITCLMFLMFGMTTDSVGNIIPAVIAEFSLSHTAVGALHYAPMVAIGASGVLFGYLADKLGRRATILLGLSIFAVAAFLFAVASTFAFVIALVSVSGVAIGIFKTGALALIGDITRSNREHTTTMNAVEAFFGIGAIVGTAAVVQLLSAHVSWKWLYVGAALLCVALIATASLVNYPATIRTTTEPINLRRTARMMKNRYALGFSLGLSLYVAVECAIYVWMPTLLLTYTGDATFVAAYALSLFFVLRAAGRFLGAWILGRYNWTAVLALFSGAILACFAGAALGGVDWAVYLLPLSGLFMSVIYPTLNSKGISCSPKAEHGSVAGVILFFSCLAAAAGPLAMGAVSDAFGGARYGFMLATGFAGLLFAGLLLNWIYDPTRARLHALDQTEYQPSLS